MKISVVKKNSELIEATLKKANGRARADTFNSFEQIEDVRMNGEIVINRARSIEGVSANGALYIVRSGRWESLDRKNVVQTVISLSFHGKQCFLINVERDIAFRFCGPSTRFALPKKQAKIARSAWFDRNEPPESLVITRQNFKKSYPEMLEASEVKADLFDPELKSWLAKQKIIYRIEQVRDEWDINADTVIGFKDEVDIVLFKLRWG